MGSTGEQTAAGEVPGGWGAPRGSPARGSHADPWSWNPLGHGALELLHASAWGGRGTRGREMCRGPRTSEHRAALEDGTVTSPKSGDGNCQAGTPNELRAVSPTEARGASETPKGTRHRRICEKEAERSWFWQVASRDDRVHARDSLQGRCAQVGGLVGGGAERGRIRKKLKH